jgi:hypothetical protein
MAILSDTWAVHPANWAAPTVARALPRSPPIQPKIEAIFENDSCLFQRDKVTNDRTNAPDQGVLRVEKIKLDTMGTSDR